MGRFAPKENWTCLVYMSTAGLKEKGVLQPCHTDENAAGGRERESNSGNMSEFISLCLQEVAMLSSGYFWPMRAHTYAHDQSLHPQTQFLW